MSPHALDDNGRLWLPVTWPKYAALAVARLRYRDVKHVRNTLYAAGIHNIANARGFLQFDPVDTWTLLTEHAPATKQATLPL